VGSHKKRALVSRECVACGSCEKSCPLGAIRVHKGMYAQVDHRCAGCGRCEDACPAQVISIEPREGL
jgi:NAD-dependent dihydropyrimidine dehydrogenase PreA subunit